MTISQFNQLSEVQSVWEVIFPKSNAHPVFGTYAWHKGYLETLGKSDLPLVLVAKEGNEILGIAPLTRKGTTATFLASFEVTDYLGLIAPSHQKKNIWEQVIAYLKAQGITHLDLRHLSPDEAALLRDFQSTIEETEVSPKVTLPETFEAYVQRLPKKHRHELRRKMRRLEEIHWKFSVVHCEDIKWNELFDLMKQNEEKRGFLTPAHEEFFQHLPNTLPSDVHLILGRMLVDSNVVSVALGFETQEAIYLYNSGFNYDYNHYAVGLLGKTFMISYAIEHKKNVFDFLTGDERYKFELGGDHSLIYNLKIAI